MKIKFLLVFLIMFLFNNTISAVEKLNLYKFSFEDIDGNKVNLEKFTGKPILIVNTASRCGFTPQYANLQNLFLEYKDSDLTIIATTSNSFSQEYSDTDDIKKICLVNYGVGFVTSSPMDVNGNNIHPIYAWIKEEYNKSPKWNFFKYLFNRNGELVDTWSSMTKPDSPKITDKIDKLI
jgi:glutathione peroxidase|tara:strand:- start:72 stop:608 length:537 start_codon:yes stop_codon:yes gene_type:complete